MSRGWWWLHDFAHGAKLKRPQGLHPHLPFLVACTAGAFDLEDTAKVLIKSPLASGQSQLEQAPAPFWAALQAQSDQHGNVGAKTFRMTLEGTIFTFEGEREAKRRKKADMTPALAVASSDLGQHKGHAARRSFGVHRPARAQRGRARGKVKE